jgi:uncharacterized membrane protein HdeD (DUF308 family)
MDMDIRIPIGLLFAILGFILCALGLFTMNDPAMYKHTLYNINLWTGVTMMVFGGFMLFFSLRKKKTH